jgi:predicted component of viral defense system (DUF524 family)
MYRDWTASFSIRFRDGTCIIILDKKYNIVVVDADIKGVGDGVVDVKMTFIHP